MGDPPDRRAGGRRGRRDRMKQRAKRTASVVPPRRRRRLWPAVRRIARWALVMLLVAGGYGGFVLSRLPVGQEILAEAGDRALAFSARLGLVVTDIEVE